MKNNKLFCICIIFWIMFTILRVLCHQPWYDEAHAYMLVQNYSFLDLISEMREEGHLMVWYLLIMPFAKLKLWYPYPMQILNWLFAFVALLIMWKKAPFHPVTKIIITFSYPFLAELPVVARCYAVGVMLLFFIASLYKNALKHPIWYAVLIALCANTSVMALFGASAFGFVFAYDLIKGALAGNVSRKDFRIAFSVLALSAVLVLWQIGSSVGFNVPSDTSFLTNFSDFILGKGIVTRLLTTKYFMIGSMLLTLIFTPIILFVKNRKLFFVCMVVLGGMMYCFLCKYPGYSQHFMFFWIYALILYWLMIEADKKNVGEKSKTMILAEIILVLFWSVMFISVEMKNHIVYNSNAKTMANSIKKSVDSNSRIIFFSQILESIVPYLEHDEFEIYSYITGLPATDCKNNFSLPIFDNRKIYPSLLAKAFSKDKTNYVILSSMDKRTNLVISDKHFSILFEPVLLLKDDFALYKVVKVTEVNEK